MIATGSPGHAPSHAPQPRHLSGSMIGQFTPWCMATLGLSGTFYFFAAMCVPYMLIMWRLVPETTGKSLEEIEDFWR